MVPKMRIEYISNSRPVYENSLKNDWFLQAKSTETRRCEERQWNDVAICFNEKEISLILLYAKHTPNPSQEAIS